MSFELIAILLTALIQSGMLTAALVMLYRQGKEFERINAYDAVIFRRVEEVLTEIRSAQ